VNRRLFLRSGLAASGALLLGRRAAQAAPPSRKIVIVGAGLAGLVAAYELGKANFDVRIVEAQDRVGGRVHTFRSFGQGLYADAGAARIPDDHDLTHKYVKEFGLPLIPFYPDQDKFVRFRGGVYEPVDWDKFEEATQMVVGLGERRLWKKIQGGNDLLPKAFAQRLPGKILYGSPVTRIEQSAAGVRVKFMKDGRLSEVAGDLAVCTVPFSVLSKIEMAPAFSESKMRTIEDFEYDSASRVFVETDRRFWKDKGLNGFGFGENAAEIWDASFGEPGTHGLIETYIRGGYSLDMTRTPEAERAGKMVEKLTRLYPDLASRVVGGASKCWSEDPWVMGAWSHPGPAQVSAGRIPEGRVYFAGEHLSGQPSWMQGALESGLRAAKDILAVAAVIVRS
jgi:monoamine oxidase